MKYRTDHFLDKLIHHEGMVLTVYEDSLGIETIGIGIMDSSVERYYEKNTVINNLEDLPGQVMDEIKRILTT